MSDYKVSNGLKKAYYAICTSDLTAGTDTYSTVKPLGELIEISVAPSESSSSLYAGNREVLVDQAMSGIEVSFTVPGLSDAQMCDLFGYKKATGGGIIRDNNVARPYIAIMFEQTNVGGVVDYHTLYKGKLM